MIEKMKTAWATGFMGKALAGPNRKRILWISGILLGVIVIAAVAFNFLNGRRANLQPSMLTSVNYQTEAAQIGVLADTVSTTGTVEAGQLALLSWQTTGIVEQVNVVEGEQVERGDTLASLQLSSVPENVISAQADLLEAQLALKDFYASFEGLTLAETQKAVADAQDTYEDALYTYNSLLTPADDLLVQDAYAEVVFARDPLEEALKNYEKYGSRSQENENRARAVQALADAQSIYDAAVREYNALAGIASNTQVAVAAADLAVAQETFYAAQVEYERLLAGPTDAEIAAAEAEVAAAQATLNQRLLLAPFDGVVTLVHPQAGDYVEADSEAFELQNPSTYLVQIEVNELDINQIQVGQTASVVLDAQTDVTYPAEVKKVGSIGDNSSGVVTFTVVVQVLEPDDLIKSGMTAVVEIQTSTGKEALLIPNQAVRIEDGQQVVYVMGANGVIAPVQLSIGASSSTHSEVVTGSIQPGDLIVLNPPTTLAENAGGPSFNFIGPGGGGGGPAPRQP